MKDTSSTTPGPDAGAKPVFTADLLRVFQKTEPSPLPMLDESADELADTREKADRVYRCARCAAVITAPRYAIEKDGRFTHHVANPAGIVFYIGCFSEAPGCSIAGEPTMEYTWFPGYSWSYALCAQCGIHMGWSYRWGVASFFGLILDRLQEGW